MPENNRKRESNIPLADIEAELILVTRDIEAVNNKLADLKKYLDSFTSPIARQQVLKERDFFTAKLADLNNVKEKLMAKI
jgi:hypothetical protein